MSRRLAPRPLKTAAVGQCVMELDPLQGDPLRSLHGARKVTPGKIGDFRMLEMPGPRGDL